MKEASSSDRVTSMMMLLPAACDRSSIHRSIRRYPGGRTKPPARHRSSSSTSTPPPPLTHYCLALFRVSVESWSETWRKINVKNTRKHYKSCAESSSGASKWFPVSFRVEPERELFSCRLADRTNT